MQNDFYTLTKVQKEDKLRRLLTGSMNPPEVLFIGQNAISKEILSPMSAIQNKKIYIPASITNKITVMPLDFLVWPLVRHIAGHIITYPDDNAK